MKTPLHSDAHHCYHCGSLCQDELIIAFDKAFCCAGCKMVFELLNQKDLSSYYNLEQGSGISGKFYLSEDQFSYLNNSGVKAQLISFRNDSICNITFYIPQMHCSSCVWLLENLHKLNSGIVESMVNLQSKEISISFLYQKTSLKEVVLLLAQLGYEPVVTLTGKVDDKINEQNQASIFKVSFAGFYFSNIILIAFWDYLAVPYLSITLTMLLILYSFELGIPYLSPEASEIVTQKIEMICSKTSMVAIN